MPDGWHFDEWSAVSVTLDDFSSPEELSISRSLQLKIIDCALPGVASLPEGKKLEIGLDYCRHVQTRLTLMFRKG